jgi:hypothetical protein
MALETFAPDQWAQNLTAQQYQQMLQAGWPDEDVQQAANTLFNFSLLCGQLLMQEHVLQVSTGDDQTQQVELTEDMASQIMDFFSEALAQAMMGAMQMRLPPDPRQRIIETLAEGLFTYCKQLMGSVLTTSPPPPREEISQWLNQTAQDALQHFVGEYEKEFGPITPLAEDPAENTPDGQPSLLIQEGGPPADIPEQAVSAEDTEPLATTPAEQAPPPAPQAGATTGDAQRQLKLGAIALLLKSLPASAHPRVLRLFPTDCHADIKAMAQDDAWLDAVDTVALNQQLQGLKQVLQQPADHPTGKLAELLTRMPWSTVTQILKPERRIWLQYLNALRQGDEPEQPLPQFMQQALYAHLMRHTVTEA